MLTNRLFEDVYGELYWFLQRHEGATHLSDPSYLPMREACQYLLTHNLLMGTILAPGNTVCFPTVPEMLEYDWKQQSALLHVSLKAHRDHAVVWDAGAQVVRDPSSCVEGDQKLTNYRIATIFPITELT